MKLEILHILERDEIAKFPFSALYLLASGLSNLFSILIKQCEVPVASPDAVLQQLVWSLTHDYVYSGSPTYAPDGVRLNVKLNLTHSSNKPLGNNRGR